MRVLYYCRAQSWDETHATGGCLLASTIHWAMPPQLVRPKNNLLNIISHSFFPSFLRMSKIEYRKKGFDKIRTLYVSQTICVVCVVQCMLYHLREDSKFVCMYMIRNTMYLVKYIKSCCSPQQRRVEFNSSIENRVRKRLLLLLERARGDRIRRKCIAQCGVHGDQ